MSPGAQSEAGENLGLNAKLSARHLMPPEHCVTSPVCFFVCRIRKVWPCCSVLIRINLSACPVHGRKASQAEPCTRSGGAGGGRGAAGGFGAEQPLRLARWTHLRCCYHIPEPGDWLRVCVPVTRCRGGMTSAPATRDRRMGREDGAGRACSVGTAWSTGSTSPCLTPAGAQHLPSHRAAWLSLW